MLEVAGVSGNDDKVALERSRGDQGVGEFGSTTRNILASDQTSCAFGYCRIDLNRCVSQAMFDGLKPSGSCSTFR